MPRNLQRTSCVHQSEAEREERTGEGWTERQSEAERATEHDTEGRVSRNITLLYTGEPTEGCSWPVGAPRAWSNSRTLSTD